MPGVAETGRHDLARVDGGQRQVLVELRAAGQHLPVGTDGQAVAVEHQLVLAAHGVHEHHRGEIVHRALHDHPLPVAAVSAAVGGRGDVHEHLSAGQRLGHRGRARLPDVLAHGNANGHAVQVERDGLGPALEVAVLVEDPVVGEIHLAVYGGHPAVREHGRGVVHVVGALRKAHHGRDPVRLRGQLLERRRGGVQEARLQQQVLRRVSGEGQLREHDHRGLVLARTRRVVGDLARVAADVAHRGVDLRKGHSEQFAHGSIIAGSGGGSRA